MDRKIEPRIPLSKAAEIFFPHGGITTSSLRTEVRNGRLAVERIAGKDFVTESAIEDMLTKCRVVYVEDNERQGVMNTAPVVRAPVERPPQAAIDAVRASAKKRKDALRRAKRA